MKTLDKIKDIFRKDDEKEPSEEEFFTRNRNKKIMAKVMMPNEIEQKQLEAEQSL